MSLAREIIVQTEPQVLEVQPAGYIAEYTAARNAAVAEHIAPLIGADTVLTAEEAPPALAGAERYYVPNRPLLREYASRLGIQDEDDLFGGVVTARIHHEKAILHSPPTDPQYTHPLHSALFVDRIESATLPGYTAFSADDVRRSYELLTARGYEVRWKDPSQEGGNGQCVLRSPQKLEQLLAALPAERLASEGVVLESNLDSPVTLSIGTIALGGKRYSYYGMQQETELEGHATYGGTTLTMMRGSLADLASKLADPEFRLAVEQAQLVHDAYSWYEPILSRANFDVVQGRDPQGAFISGVVDQSLRIGGASPAELLAIEALESNPNMQQATAQVQITWDKPAEPLNESDVVFFDHPRRRDVARVLP